VIPIICEHFVNLFVTSFLLVVTATVLYICPGVLLLITVLLLMECRSQTATDSGFFLTDIISPDFDGIFSSLCANRFYYYYYLIVCKKKKKMEGEDFISFHLYPLYIGCISFKKTSYIHTYTVCVF
jgi:hypothetical protein